eukprot:1245187-Rhodomonas_salina.1
MAYGWRKNATMVKRKRVESPQRRMMQMINLKVREQTEAIRWPPNAAKQLQHFEKQMPSRSRRQQGTVSSQPGCCDRFPVQSLRDDNCVQSSRCSV